MPTFLWSGKTPAGVEEVERVTAETAAEARKILEALGWTDLRQHTTEVHDFVRQQIRTSPRHKDHPDFTPKEDLAFLHGTAPGFGKRWLKALIKESAFILAFAVWLAWSVYHRNTLNVVLAGIGLAALLLLFPVLHLWYRRTKFLFQKVCAARTWHRWNDVLHYLERIQRAQRSTNIGIGEAGVARYRALALAGLGQLEQAVADFRETAERTNMPEWLFCSQLAAIYTVARQYDKGLEALHRAMDSATDKSTVCIDLGSYLVRRFNRPDEARRLLAQAETLQLSELARVHLHSLRGAIAFREKDFKAMDKHMHEALAGLERHAVPRPHIFEAPIRTVKGYLAVSSAALGNKSAARSYFAQAEKLLAVTGMDDLLAEYRALMQSQ